MMEKVWGELKKIEAQAKEIRSEAQNKAKSITDLAKQESEKLIANGKTYAEEEAKQLYANAIEEAHRSRDQQLKANKLVSEKLKSQAEKHLEDASSAVVNAVLGETKH
jgi:vacuolar-type H+-ATPase subunit H